MTTGSSTLVAQPATATVRLSRTPRHRGIRMVLGRAPVPPGSRTRRAGGCEDGGVTATVLVDPALWFFLAPRHRHRAVTVPTDDTSTMVHIIEALGVPRTEWGELRRHG